MENRKWEREKRKGKTGHAFEQNATSELGALSHAEMTAKIGAAIGKALRFEPIIEDEVRREMIDGGEPDEIVAAHLSICRAIREGRLAGVMDTVERVLGRKPITFEQWVQENIPAFVDRVRAAV